MLYPGEMFRLKKSTVAAAIIGVSACWSLPASACRGPQFARPYLHGALPSLPEGVLAAEVEITTSDIRSHAEPVFEARIIKRIRGEFPTAKLIIDPIGVSSCDAYPQVGDRGILVGRPRQTVAGLAIDPIRAPSWHEWEQRQALKIETPRVQIDQ